ncbi:hypothetical protein GCM10029978_069210 [Actinoallomurus acanthiterrae]
MKFGRTALLLAASGAILAAVPPASAQAAAKPVPIHCGKVGLGKTTAWVKCRGRGYARLKYQCKGIFGHSEAIVGRWHKMNPRKDTKIVTDADCMTKILWARVQKVSKKPTA